MELTGIHHVTAVSGAIRDNHRFYTATMGMRLVKRSVNQDDVSAYHLFYADSGGTPGTDLTFFDWPVNRERRGTHAITSTGLRVGGEASLVWWQGWLADRGVKHGDVHLRDGRPTLDVEDGEGMRLSLVDDGGVGNESIPYAASPVPTEHQIHGLGPIVLSVPDLRATHDTLTRAMGLRPAREYQRTIETADGGTGKAHTVHVYEMGAGGPAAELHVAVQPDLPITHGGAGGVHHVAFRTPNDTEYEEWVERLASLAVPNSGPVDRYWFRSLYFREPNGILFEIATDGPGFAVDESPETLGEHVVLPPFLEPKRDRILAGLKPLD